MATRVFLLSADEKAVHVITQILDEQDIRFEHSSDPTFTLKRLAGQHFDVLVVDCDNTESAMQVFNSARASHLNKSAIAVAIVEGKAGVPSAFRLGASLVLTKPVSLDQARNTLRTAVGMTKKDTTEARPMVTPPASSTISAPASSVTQLPTSSHTPLASPSSAHPTPVPRVQASAAATSSAPVPVPPPVPSPIPERPVISVSASLGNTSTPAAAKMAEIPTLAKPAEVPPKEPLSIAPSAPPVTPIEAAVTDKPLPVLVPKPPSALQVSETRIQEAEPEIKLVKIEEEKVDVAQKAESDLTLESMSLSSAMLESPELKATIDQIESSLAADSQADSNFSGKLEMFAPSAKEKEKETEKAEAVPAREEAEESAASLRAGAVPAFGGLGKQPFAGIEPTNNSKRGLVIGSIAAILVAAGFAGAWLYAPGFKNTISWEYAQLMSQVRKPKSVPVTVTSKPLPAPQPAPVPAEPASGALTDTPPTTASATSVTSPAGPALATPTPSSAPAPVAQAVAAPAVGNAPAKNQASTLPVPAPATQTKNSSPSLVNASANSIPAATAKSPDLFEVPEDFADDQVIHRVHPAYPAAARARKIQGSVVLQAIIDKQGKVDSLQLVSGDPVLAQAAADAVKQWRYKPYSHNNEPIEFQTRVTVDFKLP